MPERPEANPTYASTQMSMGPDGILNAVHRIRHHFVVEPAAGSPYAIPYDYRDRSRQSRVLEAQGGLKLPAALVLIALIAAVTAFGVAGKLPDIKFVGWQYEVTSNQGPCLPGYRHIWWWRECI